MTPKPESKDITSDRTLMLILKMETSISYGETKEIL